ncbi:MAG: YigZ family protein [Bacteroidota bacterium]|nr:YigZ family protein [Bacteroidota bacterium]
MEQDEFRTITAMAKGLYKEKGSKFISIAVPVRDEDEVQGKLEEIRKQYHDARHHCYAFRLGYKGETYRTNDDGEPSGTAGKPIYGQILSKELTDILIIVVRYFGGTKLGVSGLITAYKSASRDALEQAKIITGTIDDCYEVHFAYPLMNEVMRLVKNYKLKLLNQHFELTCTIVFLVRRSKSGEVHEKFSKINGVKIGMANIR